MDVTVLCKDTVWSPSKSSEKHPVPSIIRISRIGRVSAKFNETLVVVNATYITNGTVMIDGIKRPLLEVNVFPFDLHKVVNFT
jgi:hypothetical protein